MFYKGDQINNVDLTKEVYFDSHVHQLNSDNNHITVSYYLKGATEPTVEKYDFWTYKRADAESGKLKEEKKNYSYTYIVVYKKNDHTIQYSQLDFAADYAAENARRQELNAQYDEIINGAAGRKAAIDEKASEDKTAIDTKATADKKAIDDAVPGKKSALETEAAEKKATIDTKATSEKAGIDEEATGKKTAIENKATADKEAVDNTATSKKAAIGVEFYSTFEIKVSRQWNK